MKHIMKFVCQTGGHNKFWNIEICGNHFNTSWGPIGSDLCSTNTKSFWNKEECNREANKLIQSKLNKGYVKVYDSEKAEIKKAPEKVNKKEPNKKKVDLIDIFQKEFRN